MVTVDRIFTLCLLAVCAPVCWLLVRLAVAYWRRYRERRANGRRLRRLVEE